MYKEKYLKIEKLVNQLLFDYYKKRKLVDDNFIKKIVYEFIKIFNLTHYIDIVCVVNEIDDDGLSGFGYYDEETKVLVIFYKGYMEYLKDDVLELSFCEEEKLYHINFRFMQGLLHELEHILQERKGLEIRDSIEGIILNIYKKYYIESDIEEYNLKYFELYAINPKERLADYYSYVFLLGAIENNVSESLSFYEKATFLEYLLNGYKNLEAPTLKYFNNIGYDNVLKSDFLNLSVEDKLKLGLTLGDDELKRIREYQNECLKKF